MGKLQETLLKTIEDIEQTFQKEEDAVLDLPTPEEAAAKSMAPVNPILQMAIEQAAARKIKDEYHGFK